ncbi:tyrosine-protein phosphatase [Actinotalea ferrariae]|nr:tyrosine-protein phosphatase [Actinotalea ferrariae]
MSAAVDPWEPHPRPRAVHGLGDPDTEQGLLNLRDLGGIPVTGGTTRHGVVLRSDDLSRATTWEVEALLHAGLSTVVDLRSPHEVASAGTGPLRARGVEQHHLPLLPRSGMPGGLVARLTGNAVTPDELGRWYAMVTLASAPLLVGVLELVARAEGAVLVHCTAGKDRAGIVAACLLTVLGAGRDDVVLDYTRTSVALPALRRRLGLAAVAADVAVLVDAHPGTMAGMLTVLHEEHGGVREVLGEAGLTDATTARLRDRLVVATPARTSA